MELDQIWKDLARPNGKKIVYVIMDGLGGLGDPERGKTELQAARTPNLDFLATQSSCGLLETVGPGITPGSGPGHLALFGYDPFKWTIGRGILASFGIDFSLQEGDTAARINFASKDNRGNIIDRRAGRIDDKTNHRLCEKILNHIDLDLNGEIYLKTVNEHRAVLVLRDKGFGSHVTDTDPQRTNVRPLDPKAKDKSSQKTVDLIINLIAQVEEILSDEEKANTILLRGFDKYHPIPTLNDRFGLRGLCIAEYPMYRGLSRLLGMDLTKPPEGVENAFELFRDSYLNDNEKDFFFLHIKDTDSSGEDGDFSRKVETLENIDHLMPLILNVHPDVLVVTADHSTPSIMGRHSWHPVPVLIHSEYSRGDDVHTFDESACISGSLGIRPGLHLMGLALAHAGRLRKYGA
jgi:2,3-bisphosphoglycerate-independent phosphoglycerate mutase